MLYQFFWWEDSTLDVHFLLDARPNSEVKLAQRGDAVRREGLFQCLLVSCRSLLRLQGAAVGRAPV